MNSQYDLPQLCIRQAELRNHLSLLQGELVDLINTRYPHFINLIAHLLNLHGAFQDFLPMHYIVFNDLRSILSTFKEDVRSFLSTLQNRLQLRSQASSAREFLQYLLAISHSLSQIEKLLLKLDSSESEGSTTRSSLLNRIAGEMNKLNFYVAGVENQAVDMPTFVKNKIQSARKVLDASLSECFEMGLKHRDEAIILGCMRVYATLDSTEGAHEVFRVFVVAPIMEQIFSSNEATYASWPTSDLLKDDLNEIRRRIEIDCKFLLEIAKSGVIHHFDFLGSSILQELHNAILERKPGAFSPTKPFILLENYKASLEFLDYLEAQYCSSRSSVTAFRSQSAYTHFIKRWNLSLGVFFILRFQEIAGELDAALKVTSLGRNTADNDSGLGLALAPSVALERCLLKCWQEDMFVPSLSHKFLSLTLQLISRYSTWLAAGLKARKSGSGASGVEWALVASQADFLLVKHDVELLIQMLKGSYLDDLLNLFCSSLEARETLSLVQASIQQGADTLMKVMSDVAIYA